MKTLKFIVLGLAFIVSNSMHSQVSVNVNIGSPPAWGPVGYTEVEYYYIPDIQMYYDVPRAQYIYLSGGRWIHSRYLPRYCRNYDLYNGYKVVLNDYHGRTPYVYFKDHKVKYHKGYNPGHQKTYGSRGNSGHKNYGNSGGGNHKQRGESHREGGGSHKQGGGNQNQGGGNHKQGNGGGGGHKQGNGKGNHK